MGVLLGFFWIFVIYAIISLIWIQYEKWRYGAVKPSLFHDLIAIVLAYFIYLALIG